MKLAPVLALAILTPLVLFQNCGSTHSNLINDGTVDVSYTGPACELAHFKIPEGAQAIHYSQSPCGSITLTCDSPDQLTLVVGSDAAFTVIESPSAAINPPAQFNIVNAGNLTLSADANADNVGYSFSLLPKSCD